MREMLLRCQIYLLLLLLLLLSVTTLPVTLDVEPRGTSSPRISLPEGSLSHPTVTATCRPRTWMQQLTEGQTTEPRREDASSSESNTSIVETLPEDIPDELGHEWRELHPFELHGVRLPTDTMPPNQRRLAVPIHNYFKWVLDMLIEKLIHLKKR